MKHIKRMEHTKRILLFLMMFAVFVLCAGCGLWGADHNWNLLLKSANGTEVVAVVPDQDDPYVEWLEKDFAPVVKEAYGIDLIVKRIAYEKLYNQLELEKQLRDKEEGGKGSIDLILLRGDGYAALKRNDLIYHSFAEKLPNIRLLDMDALSYKYRDGLPNEGSYVPVARNMLTMLYSSEIFYDSPQSYAELLDTISKLKGYATYPDPRTTKEGEAFLLGMVAEAVNMEPYMKESRNLADFESDVRKALRPLATIRANIMDAGLRYPTNIEQLFTDKKSYFSMSMDFMRVGEKVKEYEYPESTTSFVIPPVGTYSTVGLIPFNSENKSGAMVVLSELLSPASQAAIIPKGLMTVYYRGIPIEAAEPLKQLKLHRVILKFSSYMDCIAPDFDRELVDIVLKVWEDLVVE